MKEVIILSKYFIDKEIYFQNKKLPPRKVIIKSMIYKEGNESAICYDEDGNEYSINVKEIYDDKGNAIKDARERLHMTQSEFAKFLDMPKRTLEDWENGKSKPAKYIIEMMMEKVFAIADMKEGM